MQNGELNIGGSAQVHLADGAAIRVQSGGTIIEAAGTEIWSSGSATGVLRIEYGGTRKVNDAVTIGAYNTAGSQFRLASGAAVELTKTAYTVQGPVHVPSDFVLDANPYTRLTVSSGANLIIDGKTVTIKPGALARVDGAITVANSSKLILESGGKAALFGTIAVQSGGAIYDRGNDQVWEEGALANGGGKITIVEGGKGYLGNADTLFVGTNSDKGAFYLEGPSSVLTIHPRKYEVLGTLAVNVAIAAGGYVLPANYKFQIMLNSTLRIDNDKMLTIVGEPGNPMNYYGTDNSSSINIVGTGKLKRSSGEEITGSKTLNWAPTGAGLLGGFWSGIVNSP